MSVEKLYEAVRTGRIKPDQLNNEGKAALRDYIQAKNSPPGGMGALRANDVIAPPAGMGGLRTFEEPSRAKPLPLAPEFVSGGELRSRGTNLSDIANDASRLGKVAAFGVGEGLGANAGADFLTRLVAKDMLRQDIITPEQAENMSQNMTVQKAVPEAQGTTGEKAVNIMGQLAGMVAPVGGLYKTIGKGAARLIPESTNALTRLGKVAVPGAASFGTYEGGISALEGNSPEQVAKDTLKGMLLGAGGDVAAAGVLKGLEKMSTKIPKIEDLNLSRKAKEESFKTGIDIGENLDNKKKPSFSTGQGYEINNSRSLETGKGFSSAPEYAYSSKYVSSPARSGGEVSTIPAPVGREVRSGAIPQDIQAMSVAATVPKGTAPVLNTVKRSEIVKFLDEKLNVPIRVGRYNIKNALGIFKVKPEVIRSRIANDLPTISHEVGHKLDKQLGLANPAHDGELMNLGRVTSAKNYTPEQVRAEGVAEFTRLYLTDPAKAQSTSPGYYAAFEKQMLNHPDIHDTLLRARQDIYNWYNQPAKARVLGVLSKDTQKGRRMTADSLYTAGVDEINPIKRFVQDVGDKSLSIEKDPFKLAWLARGWTGKAETILHRGVVDASGKKIGKSLDEILKTVDKNLDDFRAYAMAKHSLEITKQGKDTGILDADAMEVIKSAPAEYQNTLNDLVKYQDALLQKLVDAGVMDPAAVIKMRQIYPNYVPFQRVFNENPAAATEWLAKGGFANLNSPVKSLKGSARDIVDPLESIIKNTYLFTNIAERNSVGRAIVELAGNKEGLGRLVEKVDGSRSGTENVLKVYRNGQPEHYQLHPDLYRAALALDQESTNTFIKILQYPASWLRAGATLSPDFMIRNPVRDMLSAAVYSKYGFVPVVDSLRGIFHAVKKDDLYWQWMNSGGAHSMMVSIDRDYLQESLKQFFAKSTKDRAIAVVNPKTYITFLRAMSEYSELATRLGEFNKGIKKGAHPLEAALSSRDVTLDFSRVGTKAKAANRVIAFFNASLQGMDKMRRSFKEDPVGSTIKTALYITLPSVLLYMNNRNDPRYQELPQWQKDVYWIVPTKNHLFKIPKPFELGVIFGTVPERIMQWIDTQDSKAMEGIAKTIWENGTPSFLPTALTPVIEAISNYSFFMDRPIVPQREQGLAPKEQFGPYTTETAKGIGSLLNVSPRKVENVMRGYTGGLGMYAVQGSEALAAKGGLLKRPSRPSLVPAQVPGLKAIMSQPYQSGQSVDDFYKELNKMEQQYSTVKGGGEVPGFNGERLKVLRKVGTALSKLRSQERFIESNTTMSPQEKRSKLEELNMIMLNMVRSTQGKEQIKGR
jgi:hypothetical protein